MAKRKIKWSKAAKDDLFGILKFYNERNGSTVYSYKLYKRIDQSLQLITKYPNLGTVTDYKFSACFDYRRLSNNL